jgi:uncharacterized membrane protein
MNTAVRSAAGTAYLERLSLALAPAPAELGNDIFTGIREELVDLDEATAIERTRQLGDPSLIAAEALAGIEQPVTTPPVQKSGAYLGFTLALLVVGGYIVPVLGWVAALVLVGLSSVWTRTQKIRAIVASVAGGVIAFAILLALRGPELGHWGFIVFLGLPLVVNIVIAYVLNAQWRARTL